MWIAMFRLYTTRFLSPNRPSLHHKKYELGISRHKNVSLYTLVNLLFPVPLERTSKMVMHSRGCNDSGGSRRESLEDSRDPNPLSPLPPTLRKQKSHISIENILTKTLCINYLYTIGKHFSVACVTFSLFFWKQRSKNST